jgi:hypothetical protein
VGEVSMVKTAVSSAPSALLMHRIRSACHL